MKTNIDEPCAGNLQARFFRGSCSNKTQTRGVKLQLLPNIFGYALLGSTWLIMKTENITQEWARKVASYTLGFVGIFMGL